MVVPGLNMGRGNWAKLDYFCVGTPAQSIPIARDIIGVSKVNGLGIVNYPILNDFIHSLIEMDEVSIFYIHIEMNPLTISEAFIMIINSVKFKPHFIKKHME